MATDAPDVPQHLSALQRANAVRLRRADVKRDVKAGTTTIRDVLRVHELAGVDTLEDVEPAVASMTIGDLLCVPQRWGINRMRKLLGECRIGEHVLLGALTSRQRRTIVALVEGRAHATAAEAARIAERRETRNRQAAAQRARREREREAAERLRAEAAAEREIRDAIAASGSVDPVDVACPDCRSGPGEVCSTFDPVRDRWTEHPGSCAARRRRAAGLG